MVKISIERKIEDVDSLAKYKIELPNGDQVFLITQGRPLVCETREDKHKKVVGELEGYLGEYAYLMEEVIKSLVKLEFVLEIPKFLILSVIKAEISFRLRRNGLKRRGIKKVRNKIFDILQSNGYIMSLSPCNIPPGKLFVFNVKSRRIVYKY